MKSVFLKICIVFVIITFVCLVVFPLIVIGAYCFLQNKVSGILWEASWPIYPIISAVLFFYTSF